FKKSTLLLMISSGVLISLSDVFFKKYSTINEFIPSFFWNQIGIAIFGIICFCFIASYRKHFLAVFKISKTAIAINSLSELILISSALVNYYALLIAPVTLILLVNYTFQPLFVFIEGVIITLLFPKILTEKISKKHIFQKIVSILIMSAGIYFLNI
ncbi:MAG: hypothetical protein WCV55_02385, partial [Candidatus Paceibacterota bacterium]